MKRCALCGQTERRSTKQNAAYWSLLHEIAERLRVDGRDFDAKTWHIYFAERFLPQEEVRLPSGELLLFRSRTSDLPRDVFSDYLTKVEAWASERGIYYDPDSGSHPG